MQKSQPVTSTYGTTTPTNVDKDKEEKLWEQQRLVTALKRKVDELIFDGCFIEAFQMFRSNKKHVDYNKIDFHHFSNIQHRQRRVFL